MALSYLIHCPSWEHLEVNRTTKFIVQGLSYLYGIFSSSSNLNSVSWHWLYLIHHLLGCSKSQIVIGLQTSVVFHYFFRLENRGIESKSGAQVTRELMNELALVLKSWLLIQCSALPIPFHIVSDPKSRDFSLRHRRVSWLNLFNCIWNTEYLTVKWYMLPKQCSKEN